MPAEFPFDDLHGFKDYVGFVKLCAPDMFPERYGYGIEDQWTLELAFEGLRQGIALAVTERGKKEFFSDCEKLIDAAQSAYLSGDIPTGYSFLDTLYKKLKKVRTK